MSLGNAFFGGLFLLSYIYILYTVYGVLAPNKQIQPLKTTTTRTKKKDKKNNNNNNCPDQPIQEETIRTTYNALYVDDEHFSTPTNSPI
eukprot:gene4689-3382_t